MHIDSWGPYKVGIRQGNKYFLTIVDDRTRVVWIHLMKRIHEAYNALTHFINMAGTQYNKKVKKLRLDNALEFKDNLWKTLFHTLDIVK